MELDERHKGLLLALLAAAISGVSVYLNKHALASFANPFQFTFMKNAVVALLLLAGAGLAFRGSELARLSRKDWRNLVIIGLVGGSAPFLLFFWGLSQASAANASLIHKSLFIPAGALAFVFLKERLSKAQLLGVFALFAGTALYAGISPATIGAGELAVFAAVLLWSAEDVISKRVLAGVSARTVVFGRMFFGALAMLAFLAATSQLPSPATLTVGQYEWLAFTAILLLGMNLSFYAGLKRLKVAEATGVLVVGSVVTTALSAYSGALPPVTELLGAAAIIAGAAAVCLLPAPDAGAAGQRRPSGA